MPSKRLSRRRFLQQCALATGTAILAGCVTPAPAPVAAPQVAPASKAVEPTQVAQATSAPAATAAPEAPAVVDIIKAPNWRTLDAYVKYPETVKLSIAKSMPPQVTLPAPDTPFDNNVTRYIKDLLNVQITEKFSVAQDQYEQKLNLAIASGDIPDAMVVNDVQLAQLTEAGAIEELTPYIPKFCSPAINAYYAVTRGQAVELATFKGKVMALPGVNIQGDSLNQCWVRKDWLDKLGLPFPKTMDDITATLKAFIEKDPGGNGKGGTTGLTGTSTIVGLGNNLHGFKSIFHNVGQAYPQLWLKDASGKVSYGSTAAGMKAGLQLLADMYKNGLIDKEFATKDDTKANEPLVAGKAGLWLGPWWVPFWPLADSLKNDKNADWQPVLAPFAADGKYYSSYNAVASNYLVVRKGYPQPEAAIKVMGVWTDCIRMFNDAPVTYDYSKVQWPEPSPFAMTLDYMNAVERFYPLYQAMLDGKGKLEDLTPEHQTIFKQIKAEMASPRSDPTNWAVYWAYMGGCRVAGDPNIVPLRSIVQAARIVPAETSWPNLRKLEDQALLQIIVGQQPVDYFDTFVKDWLAQGGNDLVAKLQKAVDEA